MSLNSQVNVLYLICNIIINFTIVVSNSNFNVSVLVAVLHLQIEIYRAAAFLRVALNAPPRIQPIA